MSESTKNPPTTDARRAPEGRVKRVHSTPAVSIRVGQSTLTLTPFRLTRIITRLRLRNRPALQN